jgi:hypothetical protein
MLEALAAEGTPAEASTSEAVFRALSNGQQADRALQLLEVRGVGQAGGQLRWTGPLAGGALPPVTETPEACAWALAVATP